MAPMSELEEREIRDYVMTQRRAFGLPDDHVQLVQKVGRRRVGETAHDLYDVWMSSGSRFWVITHHTNLYPQADFKSLDQVFTYHLGLLRVTAEQFKVEPHPERGEEANGPWRRYARAVDAMTEAEEAEDFQAVGIRCREALIALGREYHDAEWAKLPDDKPKASDAKGWLRIYADSLTSGRQRDYVRSLSEKTWDMTVSLQHDTNATEWDAEITLAATQTVFRTYMLLLIKRQRGELERCPECDSYRVGEDHAELVEMDGHWGMWHHDVCEACGWKSEEWFDQWEPERLARLIDYHQGKWSPPMRSMEELDPGDASK